MTTVAGDYCERGDRSLVCTHTNVRTGGDCRADDGHVVVILVAVVVYFACVIDTGRARVIAMHVERLGKGR
jgi:hypothetical protein